MSYMVRFQVTNSVDGGEVTLTLSLAEACRIRLFEFLHSAGYEVLLDERSTPPPRGGKE